MGGGGGPKGTPEILKFSNHDYVFKSERSNRRLLRVVSTCFEKQKKSYSADIFSGRGLDGAHARTTTRSFE